VLERLETEAREERIGLWADPQPVAPWEWRRRSNPKRVIRDPSRPVQKCSGAVHLPASLIRCGMSQILS